MGYQRRVHGVSFRVISSPMNAAIRTSQFWSGDPLLRVRIAAFIGELITLKDTPPISSRFACSAPTPLKKNTSWPISPLYSINIQKKVRDQNKMSQTHLKSFNGRQWDILQCISGVSGSSGGLRSRNFDFLTKKKFLRKCSYLRNQTSHRVGSGVKTTVGPRATHMTFQIKCSSSSFQDRLCFIKPLHFPWGWPKGRF